MGRVPGDGRRLPADGSVTWEDHHAESHRLPEDRGAGSAGGGHPPGPYPGQAGGGYPGLLRPAGNIERTDRGDQRPTWSTYGVRPWV